MERRATQGTQGLFHDAGEPVCDQTLHLRLHFSGDHALILDKWVIGRLSCSAFGSSLGAVTTSSIYEAFSSILAAFRTYICRLRVVLVFKVSIDESSESQLASSGFDISGTMKGRAIRSIRVFKLGMLKCSR